MFIIHDEKTFRYSFKDHPFTSEKAKLAGELLLSHKIVESAPPREFSENVLELFHKKEYVEFVKSKNSGFLDYGDTPAYKGIHDDALWAVRSTLTAIELSIENDNVSINLNGGFHHAHRDRASGFCVYNDIAIGIEYLLRKNIKPILYVDIDAHHGDGVFYGYIDNPDVYIIDFHEDPRTLFPGTGYENEIGEGIAKGTKRNVVMPPFSERIKMEEIDNFISGKNFEFIIMQIGADGLAGDPLTHLNYTIESYKETIKKVYLISKNKCNGRLVLLGGGGYSIDNAVNAYYTAISNLR
ncbi:MAG: acetoin utilization protein AcuC [Thermoplasmata archaeon]